MQKKQILILVVMTVAFVFSVVAAWVFLLKDRVERTFDFSFLSNTARDGWENAIIATLALVAAAIASALVHWRTVGEHRLAKDALHRQSRSANLLRQIASVANESDRVEDAVQVGLGLVCDYTGWPVGHVYQRVDGDGDRLFPTKLWHFRQGDRFEAFQRVTEETSFARGIGLPGRVLECGKPTWIADVTKDPNFPRAKMAEDIGVKAGLAFPVLIGSEVEAVLEFFSEKAETPDPQVLEIMTVVGTLLGRALEREQTQGSLKDSEARFRGIVEIAPEAIVSVDEDARICLFNQGAEIIFGHDADTVIGQPLDILLPSGFRAEHDRHLKEFAQSPEPSRMMSARSELVGLRKDGTEFPAKASISKLILEEEVIFTVILHDITEHKRFEERLEHQYWELRDTKDRIEKQAIDYVNLAEEVALARDEAKESERRYRALAESSPVGIWQITPDGQFLYANSPMGALLEVEDVEELTGSSFASFFAPESLAALKEALARWSKGESSRCEVRLVGTRSGSCRDVEISGAPLASATGKLLSILTTVIDIADRKEAEGIIWKMAHNDPLTGLPNRQLFRERLEEAVQNASRLERLVALLFLDLDKFKDVNDSYGHPVGDQLLCDVAEQLRVVVRQTDTVARLGGDEFAIILTNLEDANPVDILATRIVEQISQPQVIDGCLLTVGTSIGVSFYPLDDADPDELIRKADLALYQAKADGRGCYHIYDEFLHSKVKAQVALENELRLAVVREEFVLHYQPQICISSGAVVGAEALIRWNHPARGMVPPGDWIPIAEASGLIIPIGEWVLRTACAQNKAWQEAGLPTFRVAVNISAAQFRGDDFVASVESALEDSSLAPRWLELEITESMVIEGVDEVIDKLRCLNETGIEIAIDDFGTGYSSLAYLKRFPVHRLKIDRSFVQNIMTDSDDEAITEAVIRLGHSLDLTVIAEGVETKEQLAYLSSRGCEEAQGFYFGRPQPAEDFVEWLSMHPGQNAAKKAAS